MAGLPRFVELVDLDGSGTLDALISANNSLYLASNQGKGVYGENTFSHSVLVSVGGSGSFALTRSVDLTADGLIDRRTHELGGSCRLGVRP